MKLTESNVAYFFSILSVVVSLGSLQLTRNRISAPHVDSTTTKRTTPPPKVFLITGAAGYIGSHMCLKLLEDGEFVVGVDNMSRGSFEALDVLHAHPRFTFQLIDIGNPNELDWLFHNYNFHGVLHFAAVAYVEESFRRSELYYQNITENTRLLVDTMGRNGVDRILYSSTCAVYGSVEDGPVTEDSPTAPTSPYGEAKLEAERYIRHVATTTGKLNATILRYFNVVGSNAAGALQERPHSSVARFGRLWSACLAVILGEKECVTVHQQHLDTNDGSSIRDYIHVDDLVEAHRLLLLRESHRDRVETFNIATETPTSTLEFIDAASRVAGRPIPICSNDSSPQSGSAATAVYASSDRLRNATGWQPKFLHIDDMLATAWRTREEREDLSYSITRFVRPSA